MGAWEQLQKDLPIVLSAPYAFLGTMGLVASVIATATWGALRWQYKSRLDHLKSELENKELEIDLIERQRDEFKERLDQITKVGPAADLTELSVLLGVWRGHFRREGKPGLTISSNLIVGRQTGGAIAGLLYYEGRHGAEICFNGIDQLRIGAERTFNVDRTEWHPCFDRRAHVKRRVVRGHPELELEVHPSDYEWKCVIDQSNSTPQMSVTIAAAEAVFTGMFIKE